MAMVSSHIEGVFEPSESLKNRVQRLLRLLKIRNGLFKDDSFKKAIRTLPEPLYISQMNNEMVKLLLFSISLTGFKIDSLQQFSDISDQIGAQIISLNAGNDFCLGKN